MTRCKRHPEKECMCKKEMTPALKESTEPKTRKGLVIGRDIIPVMDRASLVGTVVGSVDDGDIVDIVDQENEFYKILCCNKVVGFIPSIFVVEAVCV